MLSIFVVNVGSTSLKFKIMLFAGSDPERPVATAAVGRLEGIGRPVSRFRIEIGGSVSEGETSFVDYDAAIGAVLAALRARAGEVEGLPDDLAGLSAVCFKPVHARDVPLELVPMDEDVLARMAEYNDVCPAHNPPVISAVRAFGRLAAGVPLLGLFEPAFHRDIPFRAHAQSVPLEWLGEAGVRKYGFHGASHRFIAERAPAFLNADAATLRVISCHLGGSSSIAAIRDGRCFDTSMAFSPQSGLPQGNRCGDIDPFLVLHVMRRYGWDADRMASELARNSGLLGLSGVSGEFREIQEAAERGDTRAAAAVDVFVYAIQCEIARLTVALGGVDVLVFTGGIGERSALVRESVCAGLKHLGVELDADRNRAASGVEAALESPGSRVRVLTIPADEEFILARESARYLVRS